MRSALLDTGPIVACLDRGDREHESVVSWLDSFHGLLHTPNSVVTEAMHLVRRQPLGPTLLGELLVASGVSVHDLAQPADVRQAAELMARYADAPMDFADATLLLLADRLGCREILTLDRRGFRFFQTPKGTSLRLLLDED